MITDKYAHSNKGVVTAGSPYAAEIGADILRRGGNAADAAIATALALAVADPANNSLFGRCQILVRATDGTCKAIDGASEAPTATPPLDNDTDIRSGFRTAPIPGLPRALELLHAAHGQTPLADVVAPAARLAEDGFEPPAHLAKIWATYAEQLRSDPATRRAYLGEEDAPRNSPKHFRHPRLARLIRSFGAHGAAALMEGEIAVGLARSVADSGGYWSESDLAAYGARDGEVVQGRFRDCEVVTIGRQGWGHSLIEMLSILDAQPAFGRHLTADEAERLLLTFLCVFSDRPQIVGTLKPKPFALPYETLIDRDFAERRAAQIEDILRGDRAPALQNLHRMAHGGSGEDQDTTHLSVIDGAGASVAITCSIGPHFGVRVADPIHGVLLTHSYRMATDPTPNARDVTEMAPVIVTRNGRLLLSLGAAGSERIPGAIVQTIINVVDRKMDLGSAVAFPRVNIKSGLVRVHNDIGYSVVETLRARGYNVALSGRGHANHLGIVNAAAKNENGVCTGAADPAWDGAVGIA